MKKDPLIHPRYKGEYMIAIVKEKENYHARGSYEFEYQLSVMPLPGLTVHNKTKIHEGKPVLSPVSTQKTRLVATFVLADLLRRFKSHSQDYTILEVYFNVNENAAKPIADALSRLQAGKDVDLEKILS